MNWDEHFWEINLKFREVKVITQNVKYQLTINHENFLTR